MNTLGTSNSPSYTLPCASLNTPLAHKEDNDQEKNTLIMTILSLLSKLYHCEATQKKPAPTISKDTKDLNPCTCEKTNSVGKETLTPKSSTSSSEETSISSSAEPSTPPSEELSDKPAMLKSSGSSPEVTNWENRTNLANDCLEALLEELEKFSNASEAFPDLQISVRPLTKEAANLRKQQPEQKLLSEETLGAYETAVNLLNQESRDKLQEMQKQLKALKINQAKPAMACCIHSPES